MSNCLRSLWIHQGSLFCLLVLVLLIFNILFHSASHVPVSACVKHEGRSKCICWHVWRVHNTLFLMWKVHIIVCICVFLQRLHLQFERRAEYVYICAIISFLYALFHNDCLLFYLLFIATNNTLFKTNLCQCKES